jgi:hypothetical protein
MHERKQYKQNSALDSEKKKNHEEKRQKQSQGQNTGSKPIRGDY